MSKTAIISVGNELLNGRTTNTNAVWLCEQLRKLGIDVCGIWVIPDEPEEIAAALEQVCRFARIVIITGGLGPTDDDLTRDGLSRFLGVELQFRPELLERIETFFASRNITMPAINRSQAYLPEGACAMDNEVGTAPGIETLKEKNIIFCLPGVPSEMKRMFLRSVQPKLAQFKGTEAIVSGSLRCFGAGESRIAEMLGDRMKRGRNPLVNCTVHYGDIRLEIVVRAEAAEKGLMMVQEEKAQLEGILGDLVYGRDEQTMAEVVGGLLRSQKMTLAAAESCTGGLLAKMITDVPGASNYFLAGWVTYGNQAKIELLDVPKELIEENGAVSAPVAQAMAEGACRKTGADASLAITGIAGPGGGTGEKPVGLVYIASSVRGKRKVQQYRFPPTGRDTVRQWAAMSALNLLRIQLKV